MTSGDTVFQRFNFRDDGRTNHRCSGRRHGALYILFEVDHVELLVIGLMVADPAHHQTGDAHNGRHQCRDHIVQRVEGGDGFATG
jgi:hypothetical protein